ncbi:MAG: lipopolysaccharide kinase InaA family protein [Planctomycetota bacterium]
MTEQRIEDEAGVRWTIRSSFRPAFDAVVRGRAAELAAGEGSQKVKGNQVRAVVTFAVGPWQVFLKRHRIAGWKDWLRYAILPTRGENEWRKANLLLDRGFDTAAPLAVGERRQGLRRLESFSIAEAISPAIPIGGEIQSLELGPRRALLERIGRTLRRLHDAGIHHRDLHGNNILVAPGEGERRLCFIDLHSVWSMPRVPWRARQAALAKLLGSLQAALTATDRLRVLDAYLGEDDRGRRSSLRRGVEKAIEKERLRRLFTRTRRCLRESTRFRQSEVRGHRIRHRREIEPEAVLDWLPRFEQGAEWLKKGRRSRVGRFETPEHGTIVGKELRETFWAGLWRRLIGRSRAEDAWVAANGLRVRNLETPDALASIQVEKDRSVIFTRFLEDSRPLDALLAEGGSDRKALAKAVADYTAAMHLAGVVCPDLAAKNLLVTRADGGWQIALADLDRLRFDDRRPSPLAELNLVQLNDLPPSSATRTERLRFLRAYLARHPIADWKPLFRKLDRATRARIDRYREKVLRIYGERPDDTYYPHEP